MTTNEEKEAKIVYISVDIDVTRLIFAINRSGKIHFLPLFVSERFIKTNGLSLLASSRDSDRGKIPEQFRKNAEWYSNIRAQAPTYKTLLKQFSKGAPIEYLDPPIATEEVEGAKKDLRTLILEGSITFDYQGDRTRLLGMIREDRDGGDYENYLQILGFTYNVVNFTDYDFEEIASTYETKTPAPYSQRGTPIRRY